MKFGDKLILLRKKKGLSQEELAEKLGVSRQSVSKWESNNTYPETDKIVQICNIFECSMDDLINDKVTDVETTYRKNKNNLNNVIDSFLEFITKTINMFSSMKFSAGLKCIIEFIILGFILFLMSITVVGISSSVIASLFKVFGGETVNVIKTVLSAILNVCCFIVSIIVIIHTFKLRYLNPYDKLVNESKKESKSNDNNEDDNDSKLDLRKDDLKVVIKDEDNKPFAFLGVLSNIIMIFIKFVVACIGLSFVASLVTLVSIFVISLCLIGSNMLFVGSSLSLLALCALHILIIILIIYFIFNKKVNVKAMVITFISSLIVFGLGIGLFAYSLKNIDIIQNDKSNYVLDKINVEYKDNLVIKNSYDYREIHFVTDNSKTENELVVEGLVLKDVGKLNKEYHNNDNMPEVRIHERFKGNIKTEINRFFKDLKNNKIYINNSLGKDSYITVYGNENTINKIIEDTKKLYLIQYEEKDDYKLVKIMDDRVYIYNDYYDEDLEYYGIKYNALNDTITGDTKKLCKREYEETPYGNKMIIRCNEVDD